MAHKGVNFMFYVLCKFRLIDDFGFDSNTCFSESWYHATRTIVEVEKERDIVEMMAGIPRLLLPAKYRASQALSLLNRCFYRSDSQLQRSIKIGNKINNYTAFISKH